MTFELLLSASQSKWLSKEKVQKTAIVEMDLQHSYVEARFIHCRYK